MIQRLLITIILLLNVVDTFGIQNQTDESITIPSSTNTYTFNSSIRNSDDKAINYNSWAQYYKGFFDLGYAFGSGDLAMDRLELSTSHGIQLNPNIFTGIGLGLNYFFDEETVSIPIFANVKGTCFIEKLENILPFLDLKLGYSLIDIKGFYLSPSVGTTFLMKDKNAMNVSLGFVVQQCKYEDEFESGSEYYNGFCIRFGLEF